MFTKTSKHTVTSFTLANLLWEVDNWHGSSNKNETFINNASYKKHNVKVTRGMAVGH